MPLQEPAGWIRAHLFVLVQFSETNPLDLQTLASTCVSPTAATCMCCKDFLFMSITINYLWINSNQVVTMLRPGKRNSLEGQAQF